MCASIIEDIKPYLNEGNIYCGIGRLENTIMELSTSYDEASNALKFADSAHKNHIVHYDDLGVFKLLINNIDSSEIACFYRDYLEPVVRYDKEYNSELVNTLKVYFESNFNLLLTSKKLFIHRNTLNYRLKKIEDLLSMDISKYQNRLALELALSIYISKHIYK